MKYCMNVSMNSSASPAKLLALAVSEWLLVLPASVLVLAALLRLVQPREHEPARASWVIFAWARTHISHSGAGLVFIDRKSTRLNSSHSQISYAVFCLKKKKTVRSISPVFDRLNPQHGRRTLMADRGAGDQ